MYKSFSNDTFVLEKKSVIILHQSDFIANIMVQSIFYGSRYRKVTITTTSTKVLIRTPQRAFNTHIHTQKEREREEL